MNNNIRQRIANKIEECGPNGYLYALRILGPYVADWAKGKDDEIALDTEAADWFVSSTPEEIARIYNEEIDQLCPDQEEIESVIITTDMDSALADEIRALL